ncbi:MAG: reverse transcriptase family protein [Fusobacterium sp.]
MKWEKFSFLLKDNYSNKGYDREEIEFYLDYCKKLYDMNLPMIINPDHLSLLLGYEIKFIYGITNMQKLYYRTFEIKKKNGKKRKISEPLPNLKEIQRWINLNILKKLEHKNKYIKSYKSNFSIKDNAKFHRNQLNVLTIDIKDYFPSILEGKIISFFKDLGYTPEVSVVLGKLCCLNGSLPQGAPTSPLLSNLVTSQIDHRLIGYCLKNKIRYTRYADDLTFSGDFNVKDIIKIAKKVLLENGFKINIEKIRNRKQHQRQEVTGITVNKKLQASLKMRHLLRQEIYYIEKFGLESHLSRKGIENPNYIYKLIGIANFILFINPKDNKTEEIKKRLYVILEKKLSLL